MITVVYEPLLSQFMFTETNDSEPTAINPVTIAQIAASALYKLVKTTCSLDLKRGGEDLNLEFMREAKRRSLH